MHWRRQNTGPIGIDVGARCVRAVQLCERSTGCAVAAAGKADLPAGAERDPAAQQAVIARLLAAHGFVGKAVAAGLPSSVVQVKNLRLPRMPEDELIVAGELEARARFRDLDDTQVRILPAGLVGRAGDEQYELIVLAARTDAVEARLKLFSGMGLTVTALEPAAQACLRPFARFLERSADASRASAYVDMGARGTRILIACGSDLVFLKTCALGGEALDRAVAEGLSISIEQAGQIRRRALSAATSGGTQQQAVAAAVEPVFEQLGKELNLCLRYYAVTFRGERPERITGIGGELALPGVCAQLSRAAQLEVHAGDVLRGIAHDGVIADAETAGGQAEWATAVGLALRGRKSASKELKVA